MLSPRPDRRSRVLARQTHGRFIKSHPPLDGPPIHPEVRCIHVARNGRDARMSHLNHDKAYTPAAWERLDAVAAAD